MSISRRTFIIAILGVLFLSLNLRAPFTSLAPVLAQIMQDLQLSSSSAGFLTALPLLSFAFFSPFVTKISRRLGLEPSLILALVLIISGIVLRSWGLISTLYFGTILVGIGIAIGNVLLPVVVKINFPERIAMITSLYIFTMGVGSTLSSSLMVHFSHLTLFTLTGWQLALIMNLLFPLLALSIWLPKRRKRASKVKQAQNTEAEFSMRDLLTSSVAWQVTLALGLNSFTFYSLAGWLPKILNELGYSEIDAGYIYAFLQFSTMVPGILLLPILAKKTHQQLLIIISTLSVFVGSIGLLYLPDFAIFWVGLFGLGNCSTFIIALSFIGLRTSNGSQAASLSGMSQGIGYALAATGPSLVGSTYAQSGSWTMPILLIASIALVCTFFAALAARDIKMTSSFTK
jgi:CP family cyanate transporter-like MFS transporter